MTDSGRLCLSVRETAALLGLSKNACYAAVARGEIPSMKIGKRLLIPKARFLARVAGQGEAGEGNNGNGRNEG